MPHKRPPLSQICRVCANRTGIANDEPVALFCGKLIAKKRPLDAVLALSRLQADGRTARLLVAGAGPLQQDMEVLAKTLGVSITVLGFQNQTQLPRWYALADVLVLPSDGAETWGLVVNEAMACGTPAVVSDAVGCGPDLIDQGFAGEVFPLGDAQRLARAIGQMLGRKHILEVQAALRNKMARYSVSTAAEGFLVAIAALRSLRRVS